MRANEVIALGEKLTWGLRPNDLAAAGARGALRTWADRLVVGQTAWRGGEIPAVFWSLMQNRLGDWHTGTFEVDVEGRFVVRAERVKFYVRDLRELFPELFRQSRAARAPLEGKQKEEPAQPTPAPAKAPAAGGRKPSAAWPDWVAEVVAYFHEEGIPAGEGSAGVDVVLKVVSDRLAERGLECPARSTTQETMRAVLLRLRSL